MIEAKKEYSEILEKWVHLPSPDYYSLIDISFKAGIKEVVDSFIEAEIHSNPNTRRQKFEKVLKVWKERLKQAGGK